MGFRGHRHGGFLQKLNVCGVHICQVWATTSTVAWAVGVSQGGVGTAIGIQAIFQRCAILGRHFTHQAQNVVAAAGVASDGEGVAVVSRDDDECVFQSTCGLQDIHRTLNRVRKLDGVKQCPFGVSGMVGMVNAATFHVQEESFGIFQQHAQSFVGHFSQRWFTCWVVGAVCFVLRM